MMRVLIDTNICIDFFACRQPFDVAARRFFLIGALQEYEMWIVSSQLTDIFYLLTNGPDKLAPEEGKATLRQLRKHVHICSLAEEDVDTVLDSTWNDFEDACVYRCALKLKADAIITRNKHDFEKSSIKVFDCDELFAYLANEKGCTYEEIPW